MKDRRRFFWAFLLATLILDQAVKAWARGAFAEHQAPGFPWPGVFELTLTYNKGVAFGMMQGSALWVAPIAILIAALAFHFSLRHPAETRWVHTAMGLIASGALGNLVDRLRYGRVTDMFWFRAIDFPVFNLADACITGAAIMIVLTWVMPAGHRDGSSEPKEAQGPETPSEAPS
ncbi:MAG: signal peptidase II [Fimbriimonas ginsengisoli]|uniref:Lipoprotein signal peptidase n=1 Tax=Fimbriimonas ginsengisoli TaxID=1005039 RepID=A0A931LTS3_FIMGI|nr:signal peptidase II [Fimbriimonas ginsengisoli]